MAPATASGAASGSGSVPFAAISALESKAFTKRSLAFEPLSEKGSSQSNQPVSVWAPGAGGRLAAWVDRSV
jgi:hypothetical protein